MRQTLKFKQCKQIKCFHHQINCPLKRLLEQKRLIEANIILFFVCCHIYHLHIHKRAMNEQNAQAQKKLYYKMWSMPSKYSAATLSVAPSVKKMLYTQI